MGDKDKTILITGCAGFVGSSLASKLHNKYSLVGVDDLSKGDEKNLMNVKIDFYKTSCSNLEQMNELFEKYTFDSIVHLAGNSSGEKSWDDEINDYDSNVSSTRVICYLANKYDVNNLLHASSMSVYGDSSEILTEDSPRNPKTPYALSKCMAEEIVKFYRNQRKCHCWSSLRFFNIYGPGQDLNDLKQGMVSIFYALAKFRGAITVKGSEERTRDFIYISDILSAIEFAILKDDLPEVVNVCSGTSVSVNTLTQLIGAHFKCPIIFEKGTVGDQFHVKASNVLLRDIGFNLDFTTIEDGISHLLNFHE